MFYQVAKFQVKSPKSFPSWMVLCFELREHFSIVTGAMLANKYKYITSSRAAHAVIYVFGRFYIWC